MTTPAPFTVSYHDIVSGTDERDFEVGAVARAYFERLKSVPTVVDAQFWAGGEVIEEWKR